MPRRDGASILTKACLIQEGTECRACPTEGQIQGKWVTRWGWGGQRERLTAETEEAVQLDRNSSPLGFTVEGLPLPDVTSVDQEVTDRSEGGPALTDTQLGLYLVSEEHPLRRLLSPLSKEIFQVLC